MEKVPYVGQDNSIFCAYACQTMIFKHYNRNIELDDFVFNSGIGYGFGYFKDYNNYFPMAGTYLSQWPTDRKFVADLYGLEYETWISTDTSCSIYDTWDIYWKKVKNYLINDIPVSTVVSVVDLPAARDLFGYTLWLNTKKIPDFAWKLISTAHEIVLVGFDEGKKEVYYNDPIALNIGKEEKGIYLSAPIDVFAMSVANAKVGKYYPKFIISTYKEIKSSLSDDIIFKKSHKRNIQKLKGSKLAYDEKWQEYPLGIDALNKIIKEFEIILNNKNKELIYAYRNDSFRRALMKQIFFLFVQKSSKLYKNPPILSLYDALAVEKKHTYDYIKNKNIDLKGLDEEIILFYQEFKKWETISKFYSGFYKEFILSTKKDKLKKINKNFISNISDIIDIEKRIINIWQ